METGLLAQYVAVACAVLLSAGFVLRQQFPRAVRRVRALCALSLLRDGRPAWMRGLGRRIAPAPDRGGTGCGGCNGCGPAE